MAARARSSVVVLCAACALLAWVRSPAPRAPGSPTGGPYPRADVLDCRGGKVVTGSIDYFTDLYGEAGDPVDVARRHLPGLRASDEVRLAGDPGQRPIHVIAIRDGRVVAMVELDQARDGGWLVSTVSNCVPL